MLITHDGTDYTVPDDPTFDQVEEVERKTGLAWVDWRDWPSPTQKRVLAYLALSEADESWTWAKVGKLRFAAVDLITDDEPATGTDEVEQVTDDLVVPTVPPEATTRDSGSSTTSDSPLGTSKAAGSSETVEAAISPV